MSVDVIIEKLNEILSAFDDRDNSRAGKLLDEINPSELDSVPERQFEYYYLRARYNYRIGDYKSALEYLNKAWDVKEGGQKADDLVYAEANMIQGLIFLAKGWTNEARESLEDAYRFMKKYDNYDGMYRAKINKAQTYFITAESEQAIKDIDASLNYAEKHAGTDPDEEKARILRKRQLRCFIAKATVRLQTGDLNGLEDSLQALLRDDSYRDFDNELTHVMLLMGMLNVLLKNHESARNYLNESLQRFIQKGSTHLAFVAREFSAMNTFFENPLSDKCEREFREILEEEQLHISNEAQLKRYLTEYYIINNKFNDAHKSAQEALTTIDEINEVIERGALMRSMAKLSMHEGDDDKARDYFEESMSILARAKYELALTYIACGESEVFKKEVRHNYLEMALELFRKMDIPARIEEVKKKIKAVYLPYNAVSVANTFLNIAEQQGKRLNVMKLEKLVYYAHGWSLALYDKPLVEEKVLAQPYGPVFESIIEEYAEFGLDFIKEYGNEFNGDHLIRPIIRDDDEIRSHLEDIWSVYGKYSHIELSNLSHDPKGPWHKVWKENAEKPGVIVDRDIKNYFSSLIKDVS